jgi:hypothetical protein
MPRRTSRRQLGRFLNHLAATGNFALAADRTRLAKSGLYKRRSRDPAFAAECEVALAQFRLFRFSPGRVRAEARRVSGGQPSTGGKVEGSGRAPGGTPPPFGCAERSPSPRAALAGRSLLTTSGTLTLHRGAGRPQLRRSPAGRLTQAGVETFLRTLAATANVRLAANSVGVAHSSIYARRRSDPEFAQAMRQALEIGYDLLEQAVLRSTLAELEDVLDDESPSPLEGAPGSGPSPRRSDPAAGRGEGAGGGGAFDPTTRSRPGFPAGRDSPATLTMQRALWLLKLRRSLRLPEGWAPAPRGYKPNRRDLMTDAEVRAELERRMKMLRDEPES